MKLKKLLNENMFLGELPSSKLMKMKWNPVTDAEGINEANPDGTISPDEDKRKEVLMKKVSTEARKLVAMIKAEAKSIGGKFRAPGIEADARNVIRKSEIWGWMNR